MNSAEVPSMSVLMVTPDDYESLRATVTHLRRQTINHQLEVVIVAPSAANLRLDEAELKEFFSYAVVEAGEINTTGGAIAAAVRRASAPLVAYAEEHSYPDPGWAEAFVEAHRQPWAAVGAVVSNANPESMISWAHLYTDFGSWVDPAVGGVVNNLAWHHVAYKRAILLEYGPELEAMLETEGILHRDLQKKGHQLFLETRALSHHLNVSMFLSHLGAEFHGGRMFGAARARFGRWSVLRRVLYIGGLPLIPLVRARRILRQIYQTGRGRQLVPRILPPLVVGLMIHALGEATGYARGSGTSPQRRLSYELSRHRHVAERKALKRS